MKNKKFIFIVTHLAACFVGAVTAMLFMGWWVKDYLSSANNMSHGGMLVNRYTLYADMHRTYGGPEEYRAALIATSEALDKAKEQYPDDLLLTDKVYFTDKAITYTRIARLLEEQDKKEFPEYQKKAVEACKNIPWNNCSYDQLKNVSMNLMKRQLSLQSIKINKA